MKRKNLIMAATALCISFTCCKKNLVVENEFDSKISMNANEVSLVSDLTITTGMNLTQLNQVIATANAGDTIWVEPGTYNITGKIETKPGITLAKKTNVNPIFDATASTTQMLSIYYTNDLNEVTFSGITFWNLRFVINGGYKNTFKYCIFDYGVRKAGTNESFYADAYLQINNSDLPLVTNCTFNRRVNNSGRGIWIAAGTTNSKILNCQIGNGSQTGYFVTAINDNSKSNSLIEGNIINRNTALNTDLAQTDHGIYTHSFNGVTIKNNTISGWPANADGGAVKARNGQNIVISNNTFNNSGVLLYEYDNTPAYPYLNNVKVLNNTINIASPVNNMYHGIGYYRNNATGTEYSIRLEGNILPKGTIHLKSSYLNVSNFNAAGGGVFNNDYGAMYLKSGITATGNY